ncbi:MAG: hypothetical protein JSW15_09080, partial [Deltaproteobacteria bacterium]
WRATSAGVYRVEIPAEKEANINDFKKDQLNFIYGFSKALENKNYKEAEIVRVRWISFLKDWQDYFKPNSREQLAIRYDINRLSKIIGLTDPDLMDLRNEYRIAKWNKDWNTALKIQQLINMKLEEIQKLPPPTSEKLRKLNPRDRHELYI